MNSLYSEDVYDTLERELMSVVNKEMVWNEYDTVDGKSFVGYMRMFSDKSASSSMSTALVAYNMQIVVMNFTYSIRWYLLANGHTIVEYLSVKCTVTKETAHV